MEVKMRQHGSHLRRTRARGAGTYALSNGIITRIDQGAT